MSTVAVEVKAIKAVTKHPNADRLELVQVDGWQCCAPTGKFKAGDLAVYFPIDSTLPPQLEQRIFGADSKIRLNNGRVKTIRLRGLVSQGMVQQPGELGLADVSEGQDLTAQLGVTKYQAPVKGSPTTAGSGKKKGKRQRMVHADFQRYTDLQHLQKFQWAMEGLGTTPVVAHEKLHGTNFRAGWVKGQGWWWRIAHWLGVADDLVFVYGSRMVELERESRVHSSLPGDVYSRAVAQWDLDKKIPYGYVVYGEIIGPGIQKGYSYGIAEGHIGLVLFDVQHEGRWLSDHEINGFCRMHGFLRPPELYRGLFNRALLDAAATGPSVFAPSEKVREGIVVRPVVETVVARQRLVLKLINPDYLLDDTNTEEH